MMNRSGCLIILALTLGFSSLSPAEVQGNRHLRQLSDVQQNLFGVAMTFCL